MLLPHLKLQTGLRLWESKYLLILVAFSIFIGLSLFIKTKANNKTVNSVVSQSPTTNYHLACPFSKAVYQKNKEAEIKENEKLQAQGIIIPHHLLARDLIISTLENIKQDYQTIILVGPNHFDYGNNNIQTSHLLWKTKFGQTEANYQLIKELEKSSLAAVNQEYFNTEHSICSLVSFIKIYFPHAKIVPLILKTSTLNNQTEELAKYLANKCDNCLMIASLDFSHQVTQAEAEINDKKSIEILKQLDITNLDKVVCDSKPTLRSLLFYLKEKGVNKASLIKNSNSVEISNQDLDEVTSYITIVFE